MRKKSQKFSRFIASANCINYRNDAIIVEKFNESVRKYKRFVDINAAGDEALASEKLREAGTDLYQACEWALKNCLYKAAIARFENGEISAEEKGDEIDFLSKKDTNLFKLIDAFKTKLNLGHITYGINLDTILQGAQKTNNGPKHNATVPDPNTYKRAVGEIRKIIKNYVIDAELDLIEDSIYGSQNVWYELLEETNDFSDAYHYVLVAKKVSGINGKGLFGRKWDLVIDFDSESDVTGLEKEYTQLHGVVPWIRMLSKTEANRKFAVSNLPYWVMANGYIDAPETIVDENRWKNKYGRYLSDVLERFHEVYTKPVKVFIYPMDNEKNLERVIEAFDDVYEAGDDADYYVLSAQSEYSRIDNENFRILPLSFKDFCNNLSVYYESDRFIAKIRENQLPAANKEPVFISEAFAAELQDSFEVVYINVDKYEENDATKTSRNYFYRGDGPISWYGLSGNFDIARKIKTSIIDKIKTDMKDRGRLLKRVCYEPGVGGTTLMRRIAWELSEQYPTMILQKYNEQTAKNIQKIYDITHNQILIMVDNNNIEFEEAKNLQIELKKMGFSFVICYFERKLKGMQSESGAIYDIVQSLNKVESLEMKNKLQDYIEEREIEDRLNSIVESTEKEEKTPFIMAMYTFNENFTGIKPYIYNYLVNMNSQIKKMLFTLALADYGNTAVDIQFFMDLFQDDTIEDFIVESMPGVNELVKIERNNGKEQIRIRYHLFATEILRQMSLGKEAKEISFLNLVDDILVFIEDSRNGKTTINQNTLSLMRSLFITRSADVDAEKPVFSPLIEKLKEEHKVVSSGKYDDTNDAIISIFNKLVEIYPEEPHFTAHLARFYFYIDKNYDKGFANIDAAIALSENTFGYVDPFLYHMKAMGYSSRISGKYVKELVRAINDNSEEERKELINQIENDAQEAFKLFELVRKSNVGVAGHLSEIYMCINVATVMKRVLEESEENFSEYLLQSDGNWVMKYVDRATDLWEEVKKIAPETNYEELEQLEIRIKQLTSNLEDTIALWENYVNNESASNKTQARRILAHAYIKQMEGDNKKDEQEDLKKIIKLMEDNMIEESQHAGNIRLWFDAIRKYKVENQEALIMDAINKLNRWIALTDSVEAHYYRFVLKFIQAIDGSSLAESELPKLLRELKQRSMNLYNRTVPQHWLINEGSGLSMLYSNSRNKKDAISEEEMAKKMRLIVGRISNNYVNESHAYINYHGTEIYFNPNATKGEIDKSKINQRVKFGIGFSYDGPRAYNSSIQMMGKEDVEEVRNIETGLIVKCEVVKNVTYFTQVRIIGYPEVVGSIHIDELCLPFNKINRPQKGSVFDAKVLNQKFDNATQRNVWMLTMNVSGSGDVEEKETAMARALRNIKL